MLGWHQRTNEVEGRVGQSVAGFLAVVSLVKDQGDVIAGLGQIAVRGGQFLGDSAELDTIGDIASVDVVKQGNVETGADQQAETDWSQIATLSCVVSPSRKSRGGARAG